MNVERVVAGIFCGAGALLFIWKGEYAVASGLLGGMLGFFIGEQNGKRQTVGNQTQGSPS